MERCYPISATRICDLVQYILCSSDEMMRDAHLLCHFLYEHPRLQEAGTLLVRLIELYQWLHQVLAHRLTKQTAQKLTVRQLIKRLHDHDEAKRFETLFSSVKRKCFLQQHNICDISLYLSIEVYKKYIGLTGNCRVCETGNFRRTGIHHTTPLIHLLSVSNTTQVESGGDLLYGMIVNIVSPAILLL